ncbi:TetR/AcrR family transcriptional regulator, partial [Candidatus Saccharibacteria bacterium]|nr:TetR/AcrR family transcriptional regulator [Candidatus Saccharibacteria bacterium]
DYTHVRAKMIENVMNNTWRKSERFKELSPLMQEVVIGFLNAVCASTYQQWILDGKKISLKEIIEASNKLICDGLNGFFSGH